MILFEPEELLIEQLRQNALWPETHSVLYRHLDLLTRALPERRFLVALEALGLGDVSLDFAHGLYKAFSDERIEAVKPIRQASLNQLLLTH